MKPGRARASSCVAVWPELASGASTQRSLGSWASLWGGEGWENHLLVSENGPGSDSRLCRDVPGPPSTSNGRQLRLSWPVLAGKETKEYRYIYVYIYILYR